MRSGGRTGTWWDLRQDAGLPAPLTTSAGTAALVLPVSGPEALTMMRPHPRPALGLGKRRCRGSARGAKRRRPTVGARPGRLGWRKKTAPQIPPRGRVGGSTRHGLRACAHEGVRGQGPASLSAPSVHAARSRARALRPRPGGAGPGGRGGAKRGRSGLRGAGLGGRGGPGLDSGEAGRLGPPQGHPGAAPGGAWFLAC